MNLLRQTAGYIDRTVRDLHRLLYGVHRAQYGPRALILVDDDGAVDLAIPNDDVGESVVECAEEIREGWPEIQEQLHSLDATVICKYRPYVTRCIARDGLQLAAMVVVPEDDLAGAPRMSRVHSEPVMILPQLQSGTYRGRVDESLPDAAWREVTARAHGLLSDRRNLVAAVPGTLTPTEILIRAGHKMLMRMVSSSCQADAEEGLYDVICSVCGMTYEGSGVRGHILFAQEQTPGVDVVLEFDERVPMYETRAIRKLAQMSNECIGILSNGHSAIGLARLEEDRTPPAEDVFQVSFSARSTWRFGLVDTPLMDVRDARPSLPRDPLSEEEFQAVIASFSPIESSDHVWCLIQEALRQKHGTMVIVSTCAAEHADRLANDGTRAKPFRMTQDLMETVTAIDGAVLLSPDGICHAVGVILDGKAQKEKARSDRGARYNSAVRFIETYGRTEDGYNALAIVVSEDGTAEVIPDPTRL